MKASSIAKILLFLVILFLATPLIQSRPTGCPSVVESDATDSEKKEFIVILKTDTFTSKVKSDHFDVLTNCLGRTIKTFDPFSSSSLQSDVNEILDISVEDIPAYIGHFNSDFVNNVLSKFEEVDIVEESTEVIIDAIPIEKSKTKQKNLDRIDTAKKVFDGFYDYPASGGKGVNIYIVDSGVRITHTEFEGRARYGGFFCPNCTSAEDFFGHGTHVAALAAGKTFGVAKLANIIAVRIFNADGIGSTPTILKGLTYVLSAHKKDPSKKSIVNMSLHTQEPVSKAMERFVLKLTENGIHVVVSAGNYNEPACNQTPAAAKTAITVGATDQLTDNMAAFSNFGTCVDIYAPGVKVLSAYIFSDKETRVMSGTSMSTPHVSGTVALLISIYGNKSPADMAELVRSLATKDVIKGIPDNINNYFLRVPHN